jgi:carboxymethylenebutenolidase
MTINTQTVSFSSGKATLEAYLATPDGAGPYPGVVVIHEIFGLNDNIRDIARRFATEGYAALAVDLFAGRNRMVCMFRFMGGMFTNSLNHQGIKDLKAALTFLTQQPGVDAQRLGLKVIAPFYGMNPLPLAAVARSCPVVGSYPEKDFTAGAGRKLDEAMDGYHVDHDIKIYPEAKHSFFNDDRPSNYNAEASADAWQRTLAFFKERL